MYVIPLPAGQTGSLHLHGPHLGGRHLILTLESMLDGRGCQLRAVLAMSNAAGELVQVASATSAMPLLVEQICTVPGEPVMTQ